jgi:hypothetical protein
MKDLKVIYEEETGVFIDYSKQAKDFLRDSFNINPVVSDSSALYIGLYKPFNSAYVELETASLVDQILSFEIEGETGLLPLLVDDDTNAFKRNGFLTWNRQPEEAWVETTVNGESAYWLKINFGEDCDVTVKGLNLVFSDDQDLQSEEPNINRLLPLNSTSFINYHVAARNEIIQRIRNGGEIKAKENAERKEYQNITKWDLLDFGEVRQASKYLTLAKIYFNISDNTDDKAFQKHTAYMSMFGSAFKLYFRSIDNNDDGFKEDMEVLKPRYTELVRW